MLSYKEAYDKIIQAYFKDEIKPMDSEFCFCGTLSPNEFWKYQYIVGGEYPYSSREYKRMEDSLFKPKKQKSWSSLSGEEYEYYLFQGMCAALDVLKQIHIEHGEIIDEELTFTKRNITTKQLA